MGSPIGKVIDDGGVAAHEHTLGDPWFVQSERELIRRDRVTGYPDRRHQFESLSFCVVEQDETDASVDGFSDATDQLR